ncbi:MAG: hypothetical protein SGBAC_002419 [Bacillariaceae sp.]
MTHARISRESLSTDDYENYSIWSSEEIKMKLDKWKEVYPDFFHMTSAQEKYGLPAAGTDKDCPFHDVTGCHNFIVTIQDFITHPESSDTSARLPEVYWSGCLHGNERVGPTSIMHAASLLLQAASCEALPRTKEKDEIAAARKCRQELEKKGISEHQRKWLARLVSTRRIVMTPTTNALGYYRIKREEGRIDPNRDFPYEVEDPEDCMVTIAARTVNEIYREHLFQLSLTFHAGTEVVGYEWGAPHWVNKGAPDDIAQISIGSAYSNYGGGWSASKEYDYGNMNDLVYYVRGGMEDWAYAGSWDPVRVPQCEPQTFGGYPKEKTIYNNSTLRIFNMLIETSDDKIPTIHLGNSVDVLHKDTKGNGHISRNIRVALLAAELVEPYVSVFKVNELRLSDDVVPLLTPGEGSCRKGNTVMVAKNTQQVNISWTVGGSNTIDNTELWYARLSDIEGRDLDCLKHPRDLDGFLKGEIIGATNGTSSFSANGAFPAPKEDEPDGPIFTGRISIPSSAKPLDQIVIYVSARVDQDWRNSPQESTFAPPLPPQSHIANVRTNPDWHHESAGKFLDGRLDWFSRPLYVILGDFEDAIGTQSGHTVGTLEHNVRFENHNAGQGGVLPKSAEKERMWFPVDMTYLLFFGALILALCLFCACLCRSDGSEKFTVVGQMDDDDDYEFGSAPFSDENHQELELRSIS